MVAIFTGAGFGFERGSAAVLGARGQIGSGSLGRGGGTVSVNAATGALILDRTDEVLIGRGPDQSLGMKHSTTAVASAPSWLRVIYGLSGTVNTAGSTVTMVRDFQDRPVFTYDVSRNAYVSKEGAGAYDELRYSGGVWSFVDGDTQVTEYYEHHTGGAVFHRSRVVDPDGNTQTYTYAGPTSGLVTRITNADGGYTDFIYPPGGLRASEIVTYAAAGGPAQTRARYAYGLNDARVTSITIDLSPADNSIADGKTYVTNYTYDGTSQRVASITQSDGSSLAVTYDASGRVLTLTELISAGVTRTTTLAYYSGYTTVTDATGAVTTLHYDAKGQLTQIIQPPATTGAAAQTTSFAYNSNGDVISTTDPTGNVTSFQYDANGNEIWRQDRLGNVVNRSYGSKNELLTETHSLGLSLSFATSASPPIVTGSKIVGSVDGAWGSATSNQAYAGSAIVSARRLHPANGYTFLGLTDTVLTTNGPYEFDYSYYFWEDSIRIWENGAHVSIVVPSGVTDNMLCQIEYDGSQVIYRIDGVIVRQVAAAAGRTFKAGVSTLYTARGVQDLAFGSSLSDTSLSPATTRYVYDAENHLRYVVSPEGLVTEYRYTAAGELELQVEYPEHVFTGFGSGARIASYETPEMGNGYQYNPTVANMTFTGNSGITGNSSAWGFAAAPDGDQVAYVQGHSTGGGSIAQTLSGLTAGSQYSVKFLLAARPYQNGGTPVTVSFNGAAIGTFNPASTAFQEFTATFTASASTGTLTFSTPTFAGDRSTAIDNVRVVGAGLALSETDLNAWRDGLADRSSTKITYNTYDARGNLTSTNRYGIATAGGGISSAEGYSRTLYAYDPAGQLLSRVTDGQFAETFVYDGMGRVIATTDRNQGTTSIVFNDSATQTVVTLASGLVRTSTYSKTGDLVGVTESGSYLATATTTNKYDKMGRLRQTTDAAGFNKYFVYDKVGRLVAEVNHRGDVIEYRYDANDRIIATTRYTHGANVAPLQDPNSNVEMSAIRPSWHPWDIWNWRTYDKEGRLTSTMDGTIRTYEYDKSGRLLKTVSYHNGLDWNQVLAFQANPPTAPVIPAADPRDSVARNFYDKEGRLLAALDGEGYLTRNIYDRAGQLVEKIAYLNASAAAFRASGTLAQLIANQATHADDRRTRFVYDGQGLLRYEVDGYNQVTEFGYNVVRQVISTIRYAGSIAATADYTYDNVKALVAASGLANSAATRKSWNLYDDSGRLSYTIDPEGAVSVFYYNNMGQMTKSVQFAAARPSPSWPDNTTMYYWALSQAGNAGNRVTRYFYNARGELRFTVDPEGYVSRFDYDAAGRKVGEFRWDLPMTFNDSSTIANVDAATGASGWVGKWFTYDYGGELTDFVNGENNWTHYGYYQNGTRMVEFVVYDDAYTYFNHDIFGREITRIDANATPETAVTHYGRDGLGNLTTITDPRNYSTTRTFDHVGRVLTETDALGGITRYEYNAFGEVTKVTDARGHVTTNIYDRLGRLITTTDALNTTTSHSYNVFGDLLTVTRGTATTSFEYDRQGRVTKTTDAEGHYEQYTLDVFGNRISVRNKIGGIVTNAYDRRGLLVSETLPMASVNANGTVVAASVTNTFLYDSRGNRTRQVEASGLAEARTTTYIYDKADRLIETRGDYVQAIDQASHNALTWVIPSEKLKYDIHGRVIERIDALGARTLYYYDRMNRVKAELGATGTYTAFTYDQNGNVLTRRVYGTAVAQPATAGGAPPAAPTGEYRETSYSYDALNRLKTTSVAGLRTGAWNGSAYATAASATVTTTLDYDANGNVVRSVDGNNVSSFAYYDKENRKIAEVDREGYLTFYTLDAEGNVTQEDRYAAAVAGAAIASDPNALRAAAAAGGARTTLFEYDRNGRRRFERRTGVEAYALNGDGTLSGLGSATATIEYAYNGLGEVTRKTEANGDMVDYDYDLAGRLTRERRAAYVDQNGAAVRPTLSYSYDGLNALTRTRQGDETAAAGDRITRYTYGAGGRMATMTDANGASYDYYYDAAGNVLRENYYRYRANGNYTLDALLYTRDQLGRVTSQVLAAWNGSAWNKGDTQKTAFNAYGDVAQRGVNDLWQEQLSYDGGGRLTKSNSGDGVWRFFAYDGAGNRTLTLESEGTDLAAYTLDQAIAATNAGNAYVDGITATIGVFDRRGQQVATRMPWRELAAGTVQTLSSARAYNAYGEATSETDARGNTTYFSYNAMGRMTQKQAPAVDFTTAGGQIYNGPPVEKYYYDISGRMVGLRDANSVYENSSNPNHKAITRALLAGTGHGGSEALVTSEYHPDGGVVRTQYDVFGDARILWDEVSWGQPNGGELRSYDAMGRLIQQTHRGGLLTDYYGYDLLGQRISHWNSAFGSGHVEVTDYDVQGRVTSQNSFGNAATTYSYAWNGAIATTGMGTFGGWTKTIGNPTGYTSYETTDLFGRTVSRSDQGSHAYYFSYDKAGRLTAQSGPAGQSQSTSYFNTNRAYQIVDTAGSGNSITATFGYDAAGNRTYEGYAGTVWAYHYGNYHLSGYQTLQNATIAYDSHGRITAFTDRDGGGAVRITFTTEYDLVGNVRHSTSSFPNIAYPQHANYLTNDWFLYDSMNRMTLANGDLVGGAIVRGGDGVSITYDAAGRRRTATHGAALTGYAQVWVPAEDPGGGWGFEEPIEVGGGEGGHWETQQSNYWGDRREEYEYRADGYLMNIRFADEGYYDTGSGYALGNGTIGAAVLVGINYRDYMGRVTQYQEFGPNGTEHNRYNIVYDAASRVTSESVSQKKMESGAWHTYLTHTANYYYGPGGALSSTSADNYRNGVDSAALDTSTTYSYAMWGDAQVSSSTHDSDTGSSNALWTSTYYYDGLGRLASVDIADGRRRSVSFASNPNGQTLSRIERSAATNNPNDFYYFVDGVQVGEMTNNGNYDPTRVDYSNTFVTRNWTANPISAPFRWNTQGGVTAGQFGGSGYDPISPTSNGMAGTDSRYTVREGDSLASIAAGVWGDASLWYLIAEANGLSGNQPLPAGTSLIVPDKVTNIHNSARTSEVYDPNRALGDLSPTAAKPPKKANKCGMFGAILLVAIAVAVTVVTAGAAVAALTPGMSLLTGMSAFVAGSAGFSTMVVAGAIGGAMGSIASQGFGVATGIQDKFSWKAVAMAGISGAVSGGISGSGAFARIGSTFARGALSGASGSALSQGIGVALGLQKKFNFASVAAAGLAAGVGSVVGKALGTAPLFNMSARNIAANLATSAAGSIADAAAHSLIEGTDFGDNLRAALPGIIGSTIGNMLAFGLAGAAGAGARGPAGAAGVGTSDASRQGRPRLPLTEYLEREHHIPAEVQRRAWEAEFGGDPLGTGWVAEGYSKPSPTGGPRFGTWLDFNGDGSRGWSDIPAGFTSIVRGATGHEPAEILNLAQDYLAETIVVTGQRLADIPLIRQIGDIANYVISTVQTRPTAPTLPSYRQALTGARSSPLLSSIPSSGRLAGGINSYVIRPLNSAAAHVEATLSTAHSTVTGYVPAAARFGVDSVVHHGGQVVVGTVTTVVAAGARTVSSIGSIGQGNSAATGTSVQTYYPPNRGFVEGPFTRILPTGTLVDRYGHDGGTFLSPAGTPAGLRALPPGTSSKPLSVFEVVRPMEVQAGRATPWFGQPGLGMQYELPISVSDARHMGYLRRVGP